MFKLLVYRLESDNSSGMFAENNMSKSLGFLFLVLSVCKIWDSLLSLASLLNNSLAEIFEN